MNKRTLVVGVAVVLALAGLGAFLWTGWPAPEGRGAGAARRARRPGRGRQGGQEAGAGAARGARHRDDRWRASRSSRASTAKSSPCSSPTAPASSRATCCSRSTAAPIEAEIKRVEAVIAGAEAQLEQAQRDVARYTELVAKNATTQVTLNNAQTQVNVSRALAESNKATLREPEGAARLHHHPRADLRPHQHGQRQGRQFRAAGRSRAARHHQPDRADLRLLHGAAAQPAGRARSARRRDRDRRGDRSRARAQRATGPGHDDREHGRCRRPAW